MENTSQPKKTNWAMIILLVILVPVLLLGYKFISKKMDGNDNTAQNIQQTQNNGNNNSSAQNTDFLSGTWYRNDPTINSKYIFDAPQNVNGTLQGQVDMVMDDRSAGKVNYEVIGNGKLRISDPQGSFNPWELGYAYNAAVQSLEIIASGNSATYTRNPVYVPANNTVANNTVSPATANTNNNTANNSNKVNTSQLPPVGFDKKTSQPVKSVNFRGEWGFVEKNRNPGRSMTIDFQQSGSQIYGLIYSEAWDANGNQTSSLNGNWTINGDIVGNRVDFTIRNGNGEYRASGTLIHNGGSLDFRITKRSNGFSGVLNDHAKLDKDPV